VEGTLVLCDYAQVHASKLYIVGAGINLLLTSSPASPHPISAAVGILVTVPWSAHNQLHKLKVSLVHEDGAVVPLGQLPPGVPVPEGFEGSIEAQFNLGRSAVMQPGDDSVLPLAIPLSVQVPVLGAYQVVLAIDGSDVASARFRVAVQQQVVVQPTQ
jgi:Family of unknown function (DUF6941)